MTNLTMTDIGWIAGLMDGEGCWYIRKRNPYNYIDKKGISRSCINPQYQVFIIVSMTDPRAVKWLGKNVGGSVNFYKKDNPKWKDYYVWTLTSNKGVEFTHLILPYLKVKKEIAEVACHFQERINNTKGKRKSRGRKGMEPLPKEEIEEREKLWQEAKKLNKTGKVKPNSK